jgi:hypothetical protein
MTIAKANECTPFYEGEGRISCYVGTAVTGKRFVGISGNRQAGPALNTSTNGGNYTIAHATAVSKAFGVSSYDGAVGDILPVIIEPGTVVPVTAGANIAAGAEVEVGSNGQAITLASGKAVGLCVNGATSGNDAEIKLY